MINTTFQRGDRVYVDDDRTTVFVIVNVRGEDADLNPETTPDHRLTWLVPVRLLVAVPTACQKCSRAGRKLTSYNGEQWCGTCISREERRINTREMYGRGRRGY